jgi:hypothetical protein
MLLSCGKESGTLTNQMVSATFLQLINCISTERDSIFLADNDWKRNESPFEWLHRISAGYYCPGACSMCPHHLSFRNASNNGWFHTKSHKNDENGFHKRYLVEYLHFFVTNAVYYYIKPSSTFHDRHGSRNAVYNGRFHPKSQKGQKFRHSHSGNPPSYTVTTIANRLPRHRRLALGTENARRLAM